MRPAGPAHWCRARVSAPPRTPAEVLALKRGKPGRAAAQGPADPGPDAGQASALAFTTSDRWAYPVPVPAYGSAGRRHAAGFRVATRSQGRLNAKKMAGCCGQFL